MEILEHFIIGVGVVAIIIAVVFEVILRNRK